MNPPLTLAQKSMIERVRAAGAGDMGTALSSPVCSYLCGVIVGDLRLQDSFPEIPPDLPPFFETRPVSSLALEDVSFEEVVSRLFALRSDSDTYFACLAALHKSRLKYERILGQQPFASFDQVGPRGLLQYGGIPDAALAGMLVWRKWLFDLDNRAAQETGYLFEPILAAAIGGIAASAGKSPIRRSDDPTRGRQVDCLKGDAAYEFKLRVTTAASGQGRWSEEIRFPEEAAAAGFRPILLVLDPTPNSKLGELVAAFEAAGGETYLGEAAWSHLSRAAGPVMSLFLDRYVHRPLQALLTEQTATLPPMEISIVTGGIRFRVGSDEIHVPRKDARVEPSVELNVRSE